MGGECGCVERAARSSGGARIRLTAGALGTPLAASHGFQWQTVRSARALWRDDLGQLAGVDAQLLGLSVGPALCTPAGERPSTQSANATIVAALGFASPGLEHSSISTPPGVETHGGG